VPNIDRKLITIVTEAVLETELREMLEKLGASGYTVTNARGSGSRGVRGADWLTSSNIRIEIVCGPDIADAIASHIRDRYYDDYAMILYESDVRVMRPEKFS